MDKSNRETRAFRRESASTQAQERMDDRKEAMLQQKQGYRLALLAQLSLLGYQHFGEPIGLVQQGHCKHLRYWELVLDLVGEVRVAVAGFLLVRLVLGDMG